MAVSNILLEIATDYAAPLKLLELRTIIWGGSEAGKTTCARVLYEEAYKHGVITGAIDLKGDFWGLKSSADGKEKGIPAVVFGGEHFNIRISPDSGALVAQEVVALRLPWVLDLEDFTKGQQIRFLAAFLPVLYDKNRDAMAVFFDEADRYAPQGRVDGEGATALGATEDIFKRGRKHGLFGIAITQRNQAINKQVSELCDAAIVFRTPGPRAQEAALEWFGSKATKEQMAEVEQFIGSLDTGEAFICSSSPKIRVFQRIHIRPPWTYDSSATPEIGKERKRGPRVMAEADMEAIEKRINITVEHIRANDPALLKQRVRDLEIALAARKPIETKVETKVETRVVEKAILTEGQLARVEKVIERGHSLVEKAREGFAEYVGDLGAFIGPLAAVVALTKTTPHPVPRTFTPRERDSDGGTYYTPVPKAPARPPAVPQNGNDVAIAPTQGRILDVMATLEQLGYPQPSRVQVGIWLRVKATTGTFKNYLGALRSAGYIEYVTPGDKGTLRLTDAGRAVAQAQDIPTADELKARILAIFKNSTIQRILDEIIRYGGRPVPRHQLGTAAGVSHTTGTFKNYLGALRSAGLIEYTSPGDDGEVAAQPVLFLERVA